MPVVKIHFCPRCDRPATSLEYLEKHVREQHPDHDPDWDDTHGPDHPED